MLLLIRRKDIRMKQIRQFLQQFFTLIILAVLIFPTQGRAQAQVSKQILSEENSPPLYPDLTWENIGNTDKTLQIAGQAVTLSGNLYNSSADESAKEGLYKFYSPEKLEILGWMLLQDNGTETIYINEAGEHLAVTLQYCPDLQGYCVSVWYSDVVLKSKDLAFAVGPVGFNKITPANGATIPLPTTTYYVLQWTDALLGDNYPDDRYQYCIDTTNNNTCDANNWVTRPNLYSGGDEANPEFPMVVGVTYYWQVRTRDTLIYADGDPTAWWSFKFSAAPTPGFNKITPVNGSTINMPTTTYRLLNWGDAFLAPGNEYQYCIDTTNNNVCDGNAWVDRESLYSGGAVGVKDFPLAYGVTYYWQVRSKNEPQIYANGNANAWWKFTIQAILASPKVTQISRQIPITYATNAAFVTFNVKFSQAVTGVDIGDFALTTTGSLAGTSIVSVSGVDNTDTRTVTVNTGSGSGTLRLDFIDNDTVLNNQSTPVGGVGVPPGITIGNFTTGDLYSLRDNPVVMSTVPSTTANPSIINFTVTFDEAVTGVDVADFALTTTGAVSGATITGVTPVTSASVFTVSVNTGGAGAGTIRLDVVDNDTIINGALNPLGGIGAGNGNFTLGTPFNKPTFADVPTSGSPWSIYESAITSIFNAGITSGCGGGLYCPASTVTREQMAVFLLKGMHGSLYTPPPASGIFADVPIIDLYAPWIEQLYAEGITGGCSLAPLSYCPDNNVTREQMAVFLLRADHGPLYTPPAGTGVMFLDVPFTNTYVSWIERLAVQGVTSGCGGGNYCPNDAVSRAQMAVFLKNIFGLP